MPSFFMVPPARSSFFGLHLGRTFSCTVLACLLLNSSVTACRQYATPLLIREGIFLTYSFFLLEVDRATRDTTRDTHVTHRRQQEQTGAWRVWRPNQATPQQADDDRHEPVCSLRLGTWLDDY